MSAGEIKRRELRVNSHNYIHLQYGIVINTDDAMALKSRIYSMFPGSERVRGMLFVSEGSLTVFTAASLYGFDTDDDPLTVENEVILWDEITRVHGLNYTEACVVLPDELAIIKECAKLSGSSEIGWWIVEYKKIDYNADDSSENAKYNIPLYKDKIPVKHRVPKVDIKRLLR